MTFFKKNNLICLIDKFENESEEQFYDRCHFICSQNINNEEDYNKAVLYSRIYVNHKYLKCSYDNEIMAELEKMEINL